MLQKYFTKLKKWKRYIYLVSYPQIPPPLPCSPRNTESYIKTVVYSDQPWPCSTSGRNITCLCSLLFYFTLQKKKKKEQRNKIWWKMHQQPSTCRVGRGQVDTGTMSEPFSEWEGKKSLENYENIGQVVWNRIKQRGKHGIRKWEKSESTRYSCFWWGRLGIIMRKTRKNNVHW